MRAAAVAFAIAVALPIVSHACAIELLLYVPLETLVTLKVAPQRALGTRGGHDAR